MKNRLGRGALALAVVSLFVMSGLMVFPSGVEARGGTPDLTIKNIGWIFPVVSGNNLPITIYVENIGNAPVQSGFWVDLQYAGSVGFWQQAAETIQIWVNPPIRAGEIKAVETTTTALATHQINFKATADSTNQISELNEDNNVMNRCLIGIEAAPGSSVSVPLYLRNTNLNSAESFTLVADSTSIPDGWGVSGGVPPTTIDAPPGGNAVAVETIFVPTDTILNPFLRFDAIRASDSDSQSVYIRVITTPEIGISFNIYDNEVIVTGVDEVGSDVSVTSEIISEHGANTVTRYTATDANGRYTSAVIEMISNDHLNLLRINEINWNGVLTITPETNLFLTTFSIKNGELKNFNQVMIYEPDIYSIGHYTARSSATTIESSVNGIKTVLNFDKMQPLGVRIYNGHIRPIRIDTTNPTQPTWCPNGWCASPEVCWT